MTDTNNGYLLANKRVLVVDDSATTCFLLKRLLAARDSHVEIATNGAEALATWREQPRFDLILLDLMLPDVDGLSVLRRIRQEDEETPVVVVTGHGGVRAALAAIRAGADGYVEKEQVTIATTTDEFFHSLEQAIKLRRAKIERARLEQELRRKNQTLQRTVSQLREAQQALADEHRKLRDVLYSLNELVIVIDEDNRVLLANPGVQAVLGLGEEEIVGRPVEKLHLPGEILEQVRRVADSGKPAEAEVYRNGEVKRFLQSNMVPMRTSDGRIGGVIVVLRDVTQERELQRMKEDFYTMLTHDLRTPVTSILGFAELLMDTYLGPLTADQREALESIVKSARRLEELVNDFLEYSRIEAGFLDVVPQEVDVTKLVQEAVDDMLPQAEKQGHRLEIMSTESPIVVDADPARVQQVLGNLLSNAIKYTPSGGHIVVTVTRGRHEAIISVKDDGIGIPMEDLPHVFERYRRARHGTGRHIHGTGLGLVIVKEIVEAHGGRTWVESTLGEGSVFSFTLPLHSAAAENRDSGSREPDVQQP